MTDDAPTYCQYCKKHREIRAAIQGGGNIHGVQPYQMLTFILECGHMRFQINTDPGSFCHGRIPMDLTEKEWDLIAKKRGMIT